MEYQYVLTGTLSESTVQALADSVFAGESSREVHALVRFDISSIGFAEPYGVVVLAAIMEKLVHDGHQVEVICPTDINCASYLVSCGFVQQVRSFAGLAGAARLEGSATTSSTVLPVHLLRSPEDVEALQVRVEEFLRLAGGWEERHPIIGTIRELCVNVFHHADYPAGWIAGQRYHNRYEGSDYVEVAIADAGQGIRRSLGAVIPEMLSLSDGCVLERMLREGLTSTQNAYRGNGYYVLQEAAGELDGSFSLRSGAGAVLRGRGGELHRRENLPMWPGTQLKARFTLPK